MNSCDPVLNLGLNPGLNHGLPCSMGGALCALSGIEGVDILVNGPSSCTGFASGLIDGCHPLRERNANRFNRLALNGHPRIPCSEITDSDVILGIGDKLTQAVDLLARKRSSQCIAIVNSCSLGLIGEDADNILKDHPLAERILYLESTGCGKTMTKGFSEALITLIEKIADPEFVTVENSVNIIGLPISQYSWKHDLREIRRLMRMAGLQVNAVLAACAGLRHIRQLTAAALNVVINPEYGLEIARFLQDRFELPYIAARQMPIGFDATRKLMDEVRQFLNTTHPTDALYREEARCRREALLALSYSSRTDRLRGLPVAVFGEWAFVAGLGLFLHDYLGCRPVILGINGQEERDSQETGDLVAGVDEKAEILLNADVDQALAAFEKHRPVITFGSAFEEYLLARLDFRPKFFVETSMPGFNRTNLVHRPYIGFAGALTFIEAVLNCKLIPRYPYSYPYNGEENSAFEV